MAATSRIICASLRYVYAAQALSPHKPTRIKRKVAHCMALSAVKVVHQRFKPRVRAALMFKVFDKALFGCLFTVSFEADDARRAV